jgi:hypothetical protein
MSGETILDILRADEAMNTWFVVMIILLGVSALTLHRYDVQRVLIWIAFGPRSRACSLHISAMQTTTRRFDFGIAGAVTSCPRFCGSFRVFGDIETNNGARDMACCGRLAECNQCYKGWDCSSHHHDPP